jgi:hypothetical protein
MSFLRRFSILGLGDDDHSDVSDSVDSDDVGRYVYAGHGDDSSRSSSSGDDSDRSTHFKYNNGKRVAVPPPIETFGRRNVFTRRRRLPARRTLFPRADTSHLAGVSTNDLQTELRRRGYTCRPSKADDELTAADMRAIAKIASAVTI